MQIDILEFEKKIITELKSDEEFFEFLEQEKELEINFDYEWLKIADFDEEEAILGEDVLEYLEEVATIIETDDKITNFLPKVAKIAFYYTREGINYLDIVQEGTMGLIKGVQRNTPDEKLKFWIIREMVNYIYSKIESTRNEFKSFLRDKKENYSNSVEKIEKEENKEIYLTESDILPSIEAIEKKEKIVNSKMGYEHLKNRLSIRQVEILSLYFGFECERRFSIYEIEEKMKLPKGHTEKIFQYGLMILSSMEGKILL